MNTQNEIPFSVHEAENNIESQKTLDDGRKKFSGDCRKLFDMFMTGAIINNANSPVPEFRRRKLDLELNNGVLISYHSSTGRLKNWWMNELDRAFNEQFVVNK